MKEYTRDEMLRMVQAEAEAAAAGVSGRQRGGGMTETGTTDQQLLQVSLLHPQERVSRAWYLMKVSASLLFPRTTVSLRMYDTDEKLAALAVVTTIATLLFIAFTL